jgi:uncharacterized protein (TIGR03067 family)
MVSITTDPIEGTWLPFKAELSGDHAPAMALTKMRLVLGVGTYAVYFGSETTDEGSYALGTVEELHTITLVSLRGTNAGRTIPSIYQLTGDRLRICYGLDGIAPSGFSSTAGTCHYLVSYRRKA